MDIKKAVFAESCVPPLKSGEYIMTSVLESNTFGNSETASQILFVEGPRFSLQPNDVCSVYPPNNEKGSFGMSLPHIVFNRKTFPWERSIDKQLNSVKGEPSFETPWVSLLQLWENEIVDIKTDKVKNVLQIDSNEIYFPHLNLKKNEEEEMCSYIDIETSLFKQVFPKYEDLVYLCHARKTDPFMKADNINNFENKWCSVVIGARIPDSSDSGRKNKVYLVSLEGFENYSNNTIIDNYKFIRLIVLYSWTFESIINPYHFKEICHNLSVDSLVLPYEKDDKTTSPLIKNGFVPLIHNIRNGDKTVSFYRGALVPANIKKTKNIKSVFSSDALYIYDPNIGMFDVSYAYAWQIGRLIALNNKSIAIKIMQLRRQNRQKTHAKLLKISMSNQFYLNETAQVDIVDKENITDSVLALLNKYLGGVL